MKPRSIRLPEIDYDYMWRVETYSGEDHMHLLEVLEGYDVANLLRVVTSTLPDKGNTTEWRGICISLSRTTTKLNQLNMDDDLYERATKPDEWWCGVCRQIHVGICPDEVDEK